MLQKTMDLLVIVLNYGLIILFIINTNKITTDLLSSMIENDTNKIMIVSIMSVQNINCSPCTIITNISKLNSISKELSNITVLSFNGIFFIQINSNIDGFMDF